MKSRCFFSTLLLCSLLLPITATRAEHLKITLKASDETSKENEEGISRQEPPPRRQDPPKRPVLAAKIGDSLKITWTIKSNVKEKIEDLFVYLYVTPEVHAGDKAPDKTDSDKSIIESAISTDLEPKGKAEAEIPLKITKEGIYLVRIETRNTAGTYMHEHYAELDITVGAAAQ